MTIPLIPSLQIMPQHTSDDQIMDLQDLSDLELKPDEMTSILYPVCPAILDNDPALEEAVS